MTSDNRNLVANRPFWGQIITPSSFCNAPKADVWCADNEMYTGKYRLRKFYRWLWGKRKYQHYCAFVTAPDWLRRSEDGSVIGNAWLTWLRFVVHAPLIKALGFPVAYVAQDGAERLPLPPADALFVGGSTEWKMSPAADAVIRRAKRRGMWVHVGRVNSQRRIRHFKMMEVDSVDGTSLTYAPDRDFWRFQRVLLQSPLFTLLDQPEK